MTACNKNCVPVLHWNKTGLCCQQMHSAWVSTAGFTGKQSKQASKQASSDCSKTALTTWPIMLRALAYPGL